jgi:hypothetical protein
MALHPSEGGHNAAISVGTRFIASNDLSNGILQTRNGWFVREPFLLWNSRPLTDTFRVPRERGRKTLIVGVTVDKSGDAINRVPTLIVGISVDKSGDAINRVPTLMESMHLVCAPTQGHIQ